MRLVADTNAIVSALVRDSVVRKMLFHPALEIYAPDYLFEELAEHRAELLEKSKLSEADFSKTLLSLTTAITVMEKRQYANYIAAALEVLIDPDDAPFAASAITLGLSGECGILTNDPHFTSKRNEFIEKFGIRIWTTKELNEYLSK